MLVPSYELFKDARTTDGFSYRVPDSPDIDTFRSYIETLPGTESPEIFGLHPNADITFRTLQVQEAIITILDTMPKGGGAGSGLSREDVVDKICEDLLSKVRRRRTTRRWEGRPGPGPQGPDDPSACRRRLGAAMYGKQGRTAFCAASRNHHARPCHSAHAHPQHVWCLLLPHSLDPPRCCPSRRCSQAPPLFDKEESKEKLKKLAGGPTMPLTVHLRQEIDRLNIVTRLTTTTLKNLRLAISGTIALSGGLIEALGALFNARIPSSWLSKSWEASTLGNWFTGLLQRYDQLNKWLNLGRPKGYWMTGFFNPQVRPRRARGRGRAPCLAARPLASCRLPARQMCCDSNPGPHLTPPDLPAPFPVGFIPNPPRSPLPGLCPHRASSPP